MMKFILITIVLALILAPVTLTQQQGGGSSQTPTWTMSEVMDAIEEVETGGEEDPHGAIGDNGLARGCLQIHEAYFLDARQYSLWNDDAWDLGGKSWNPDCHDHNTSRMVLDAYMHRYARPPWGAGMDEADVRYIARIHNGGPSGNQNPNTEQYADKVMEVLEG